MICGPDVRERRLIPLIERTLTCLNHQEEHPRNLSRMDKEVTMLSQRAPSPLKRRPLRNARNKLTPTSMRRLPARAALLPQSNTMLVTRRTRARAWTPTCRKLYSCSGSILRAKEVKMMGSPNTDRTVTTSLGRDHDLLQVRDIKGMDGLSPVNVTKYLNVCQQRLQVTGELDPGSELRSYEVGQKVELLHPNVEDDAEPYWEVGYIAQVGATGDDHVFLFVGASQDIIRQTQMDFLRPHALPPGGPPLSSFDHHGRRPEKAATLHSKKGPYP